MPPDPTSVPLDQTKAAAEALEERISSHTVGIVARDKGNPEQGIGTGTLVLVAGRIYVLTAAHVVSDTPVEELRFFPKTEGALRRDSYLNRASAGVTPSRRFPASRLHVYGEADLAAIELHPDQFREVYAVPFEFLDESTTPPEDRTVVYCGYPGSAGGIVGPGSKAACACFDWNQVEPPAKLPDSDPARFFLVGYGCKELHPGGFSGAAVWWQNNPQGIWRPNIRLGGIIQTYYPRLNLFECLRVEVVKEFMSAMGA